MVGDVLCHQGSCDDNHLHPAHNRLDGAIPGEPLMRG